MELKPGYKQTEVGMIPEDWDIKKIVTVAPLQRGFDLPNSKLKKGIYPVVYSNGIINYHSTYMVKGPGVVTGRSGTIGNIHYVDKNFWPHNTSLWVTNFFGNNPKYIYYLFALLKLNRFGTGSGVPTLNRNDVHDELVILPKLTEQIAIANALSDADALIQSLTRLIAKKRQIKQGAMQTLLNPYENGRLKEGWHESPLREVSYMKGRIGWQGLKQTEFTMNEEEPFLITGMNFKDGGIRWNEVYHISYERYEIAKEIQLKPNDVLMTKDGTIGKLLYVNEIPYPEKASLNSHLLVFRPIRNSYDPKFLYYQLLSKVFRDYIEISKSGSTFFGLSQEAVGSYLFKYPKLEEQTRIATILSDMDTEIAALETKLAKYQQIKQGMMQNLLTGRIRLVKPESNTGAVA